jgi:hypothetical protein
MKKVIAALLGQTIISIQILAQIPETLISGSVVDDKKKPVEAATISLMKAADSSLFKISVTDLLIISFRWSQILLLFEFF